VKADAINFNQNSSRACDQSFSGSCNQSFSGSCNQSFSGSFNQNFSRFSGHSNKPDFKKHLSSQCGVTLIELVISIVILSIAVVSLVTVMSQSIGRSSNILLQDKSVQLAQAYLDEILAKRFDESTPVGGIPAAVLSACVLSAESESRASYDDVDDYHGLVEQPPQSQTNAQFSSYAGYKVEVDVSCAGTELGLGASAAANRRAKRIDVTVTDPAGQSMIFSAYRSGF